MQGAELLLLLAGSLAVTAVARRIDWPAPLLLVGVGMVVSFIPGMPDFRPDPELLLAVVLPPLLYSASLSSSYVNIKKNIRPISLLAVGLVIATTLAVGWVAHLAVPELSLPAALVLGAIVAPPDAVAAVAIGRRLGLPRRMMTLLTGESLANDGTALTAYKVAVAAATGAAMSWGTSVLVFVVTAVGGVLVGYLIGVIANAVRLHLGDNVLEAALGMLVPFAAYLIAEGIGASGVLAVVAAGLYLGHNAPKAGYATRLQETAVWQAVDVILESWVFALIGLQVRFVLNESHPTLALAVAAVVVLLTVIVVRIIWVYPGAYLPRLLSARIRAREPEPGVRSVAVVSWTGMRGAVSLAAAAGVPLTMPGRDIVVLFALVVTVGTLLIQGLTLPWVIRKLGIESNEQHADTLAEAQVKYQAAKVAIDRLDQEVADDSAMEPVIARMRAIAEQRGNAAWERLGRSAEEIGESPTARWRRLRRIMLVAEREVFLQARNSGDIDDEVFRRVLHELDLEEAVMARD